MASDVENTMIAHGARKQVSGAWIFPVHPKEKERNIKMKELDIELAEIRKLKEELKELRDELKE